MNKNNLIIYCILVFVFIVYNIVVFDLGARHRQQRNDLDSLSALVDRMKHDVKTSQDRINIADSIAAIEIGKLREDMVVLSKIRELTLSQIKHVQEHMLYEKYVRDSIGNTLIEW